MSKREDQNSKSEDYKGKLAKFGKIPLKSETNMTGRLDIYKRE